MPNVYLIGDSLTHDYSFELYPQFGMGEYKRYPDGVNDSTYFNYLGAKTITEVLLKDLEKSFNKYNDYFNIIK